MEHINNIQIEVFEHGFACLGSDWVSDMISSPFTRIYAVRNGVGSIHDATGCMILKPATTYLIPCNHKFSYSCDSYMEKFYVHIRARYYGMDIFNALDEVLSYESNDMTNWFDADDNSINSLFAFKSWVYDCVHKFINICDSRIEQYINGLSENLEIYRYIAENLSAKLRVRDICLAFGYSDTAMYKRFKSGNEDSLKKYIEKQLLYKVQSMLLTTDLNIKEISAETGFCDEYHMSRFFKKLTGIPPGEYKKESKD